MLPSPSVSLRTLLLRGRAIANGPPVSGRRSRRGAHRRSSPQSWRRRRGRRRNSASTFELRFWGRAAGTAPCGALGALVGTWRRRRLKRHGPRSPSSRQPPSSRACAYTHSRLTRSSCAASCAVSRSGGSPLGAGSLEGCRLLRVSTPTSLRADWDYRREWTRGGVAPAALGFRMWFRMRGRAQPLCGAVSTQKTWTLAGLSFDRTKGVPALCLRVRSRRSPN